MLLPELIEETLAELAEVSCASEDAQEMAGVCARAESVIRSQAAEIERLRELLWFAEIRRSDTLAAKREEK